MVMIMMIVVIMMVAVQYGDDFGMIISMRMVRNF